MLPRCSLRIQLRLGQQNSQDAPISATTASSSTDKPSESIYKPAKKRARPKPALETDDVIQPKQKKVKLAKHNLESFPTEILEKIFIRIDDIGLLHLTNTCTRFKAIAQVVFSKRYNDQYFVINGNHSGSNPEVYAALFARFGSHINAIELKHFEGIDSNHWAWKLIQPHLNRIKKLTFNDCDLELNNIISLPPLDNVTHLAFRKTACEYNDEVYDFPECHNLIEFEMLETWGYTYNSLQRLVRNNPGLQRLIIKNCDHFESETIDLIANHLHDLKKLVLVDENFGDWKRPDMASAFDRIVDSLEHLESLSINAADNLLESLQRLAKECKSLKHLGLFFGFNNETDNEMIRYFWQIESLNLTYGSRTFNFRTITPFALPVEHLPNLRQLSIEMLSCLDEHNQQNFFDVLPLILKGQRLHRIKINFTHNCTPKLLYPGALIAAEFFEKFIETITIAGKSDAQIEIEQGGQLIGKINANGVVWRSKLMYWTDCDKNDTNIGLLNLAEHRDTSDKTKNAADQLNLLDKICDYLDLGSLATLAKTSEHSKRLVNSYVKTHVIKQKAFLLIDEFYLSDNFRNFNKLKYIRLMTDLHVCLINERSTGAIAKIIESCELLDKLSIHNKQGHGYIYWPKVKTALTHIVHDSPYSMGYAELFKIVESFAKVEKIECKNVGLFNDVKEDEIDTEKFGSLRKFIFNYRGETQMKNLKRIFKNTHVRLVPVYPNSV